MVKTAIDLTERFNATLAYHQSDEISLFFLEQKHSKIPATHIYSGRVQKIVSVIASYAAARFNHHLTLFDWLDLCPKVAQRMLGFTAHFDGRVVPCDSNNRAMECIFWRSNFDGLRNAISHISHHHSTRDQLHGISVIKQLELLEKRQVDVYKTFSDQILYGTWIKREQFELENAVNPKTGLPVKDKVLRSRFRSGSFNWAGYTVEQREQFLTAKFWNNVQDPPPMHDL